MKFILFYFVFLKLLNANQSLTISSDLNHLKIEATSEMKKTINNFNQASNIGGGNFVTLNFNNNFSFVQFSIILYYNDDNYQVKIADIDVHLFDSNNEIKITNNTTYRFIDQGVERFIFCRKNTDSNIECKTR